MDHVGPGWFTSFGCYHILQVWPEIPILRCCTSTALTPCIECISIISFTSITNGHACTILVAEVAPSSSHRVDSHHQDDRGDGIEKL